MGSNPVGLTNKRKTLPLVGGVFIFKDVVLGFEPMTMGLTTSERWAEERRYASAYERSEAEPIPSGSPTPQRV